MGLLFNFWLKDDDAVGVEKYGVQKLAITDFQDFQVVQQSYISPMTQNQEWKKDQN